MAARTSERNVTPVPSREIEARSYGCGPVIPYTLSPEELEKYRGGSRDMAKGVKVEIKMTKEQYLQERLSGKNRTQIMKELGSSTPAFYRLLKDWGIKEIDAEERELELLAPVKPKEQSKVDPPADKKQSTIQEQELTKLQAAYALLKNDAERKDGYIKELEGELLKTREEVERANKHFMAVSGEQADEIARLKGALSGAAVISDQAGTRISELEEEITRLKQELSATGQSNKVVVPVFGSAVTLHVPIQLGHDPVRERLNVFQGFDKFGGTLESVGLDRERIMRELFELLQVVVGFVATDLAELLPGQDVTEHVQRFFQEHNRQAFGSQKEAV